MIKKFVSIVIILMLVVTFSSCGTSESWELDSVPLDKNQLEGDVSKLISTYDFNKDRASFWDDATYFCQFSEGGCTGEIVITGYKDGNEISMSIAQPVKKESEALKYREQYGLFIEAGETLAGVEISKKDITDFLNGDNEVKSDDASVIIEKEKVISGILYTYSLYKDEGKIIESLSISNEGEVGNWV